MADYIKKVLPNGLRLLMVPLQQTDTVTALVLVEAGSAYEKKEQQGISHFLEHMCFKGTTKRPAAQKIAHELDSIGALSNAFTSQEYTGYYAKSAAVHLPKILDILSDIYCHSTFPKDEIEKEKGVVIEEINMYEDSPQDHIGNVFMELVYGHTPAGWNIAGTKETVRAFTREDLVDYHKKYYIPSATTLVVSGKFDPHSVEMTIKTLFTSDTFSTPIKKQHTDDEQNEPRFALVNRNTDQAHCIIGFRAFHHTDKRLRALKLVATLLGQGMSSRLFQKLREEMGVCYYVHASADAFTDHGLFTISVGCDTKRIHEVIEVILKECLRISKEFVEEIEFNKAKEYVIGIMKLGLESSDEYATYYGIQEVMRRELKTLATIEQEIRALTKEEIREAASLVFVKETLNCAVIGPYTEKDSFFKTLVL